MQLIRRALVTLTIEEALLEIGGASLLNQVLRILYEKCQRYLPDCYDNPINLKRVWVELDEGTCKTMISMVKEKLNEFSYQKPISNFLADLDQIKYLNS